MRYDRSRVNLTAFQQGSHLVPGVEHPAPGGTKDFRLFINDVTSQVEADLTSREPDQGCSAAVAEHGKALPDRGRATGELDEDIDPGALRLVKYGCRHILFRRAERGGGPHPFCQLQAGVNYVYGVHLGGPGCPSDTYGEKTYGPTPEDDNGGTGQIVHEDSVRRHTEGLVDRTDLWVRSGRKLPRADLGDHCVVGEGSVPVNPEDGHLPAAVELIASSIRTAVWHGSDLKARTDMALGSFLAGVAITNAGTGAVHALAYPLGGKYRVAHGVSNSLMFPYVAEYNVVSNLTKFAILAKALGERVEGLSIRDAALSFVNGVKAIIRDVRLPETLAEVGIGPSDIPHLVEVASRQTRLLKNNPRLLTRDDIEAIYRRALGL